MLTSVRVDAEHAQHDVFAQVKTLDHDDRQIQLVQRLIYELPYLSRRRRDEPPWDARLVDPDRFPLDVERLRSYPHVLTPLDLIQDTLIQGIRLSKCFRARQS